MKSPSSKNSGSPFVQSKNEVKQSIFSQTRSGEISNASDLRAPSLSLEIPPSKDDIYLKKTDLIDGEAVFEEFQRYDSLSDEQKRTLIGKMSWVYNRDNELHLTQ